MAWFVQLNGKIFGPLQDDQLRQLASARKIARETEVSQQRGGPWVAAARIRGLFPETASTAPSPAVPTSGQAYDSTSADFEDTYSAPYASAATQNDSLQHHAYVNDDSSRVAAALDGGALARIDQSISEAVGLLRDIRQAVPSNGLKNVSDYQVGDWIGIIFRAAVAVVILQVLIIIAGVMVFALFANGLRAQ
jgi:hypothetical protein